MIPWRLTFSGIRDYPPTLLDLSGTMEHVMITGPNGAGKSTITFCMGAVLYSSKVDVEGLKSRNLPGDQTWQAKISLLFHNEGLMKIDAPTFIEFTLKITQDPGQPMKKEFFISTGDEIDQWEDSVRYASGDRMFSFSTYKKDLQYKYKVDPDLFYLIWYQQEVNQFAVMNPEERFRIFSEMHGIDKVQRDWEESMEKVKETEETLKLSETNVKIMKQELSMKKTALDRFLDHQKRLHEGGQLYIESLLKLEVHYKKEKERLNEVILQLNGEIDETNDDLALKMEQKEQKLGEIEDYKTKQQEAEQEIEFNLQRQSEWESEKNQLQVEIELLDKELEAITFRKNQLSRTEDEVKAALASLTTAEVQTKEELEQVRQEIRNEKAVLQEKIEMISSLNWQVKQDEEAHQLHSDRILEYKSSHAVQSTIDALNERITENREQHFSKKRREKELAEEFSLLEENRDLSARQLESIKYFCSVQMKAYALRDLLELDEMASIKAEQLFNGIKYTIFFDGKHAMPPNDLYHVPLRSIVPDRSLTNLSALQLKVKDHLGEIELAHAMKALWWVEQFFKDGLVAITNGILIDPMGLRGPQEKNRFILSAKALMARKLEVVKELDEIRQLLSQLERAIGQDTKQIQELNSIIHQVKESEAFLTNEHERTLRKNKLMAEQHVKITIDEQLDRLEDLEKQLVRLQLKQEHERETLEEEESIYAELGKLKEKYENRNRLQGQMVEVKDTIKQLINSLEKFEAEFDQLKRVITKLVREREHLVEAIEDIQRNIMIMQRQSASRVEELETTKQELVQTMKDLEEMKTIIPALYQEVTMNVSFDMILTVHRLKQDCEKGKVKFDFARNETGIDHAAPQNYETVKTEYERLDNEYKRTKILLDQDKERMENLKEQLETTINMRVLELQQRFKAYMGHFQFEGDIGWDSYEDRKKRTHFNLFIKARKEGHRGTMEDVSTKARGGRVGKGVSGGEESLSSLLFALALLQNLQTTPGFIVLDEFDSALDENRKVKVFDLYVQELNRKLIILTPKSHEEAYLNKFSKAFVVQHDPTIPKSRVVGIVKAG